MLDFAVGVSNGADASMLHVGLALAVITLGCLRLMGEPVNLDAEVLRHYEEVGNVWPDGFLEQNRAAIWVKGFKQCPIQLGLMQRRFFT